MSPRRDCCSGGWGCRPTDNAYLVKAPRNGNAFVARSWPGAGGSCGHGRGGGPGEEGVCPGGGALGWHEAQAAGLASWSRHCNTSIPVELLTGTVILLVHTMVSLFLMSIYLNFEHLSATYQLTSLDGGCLQVGIALLGAPAVVILDEPSSGARSQAALSAVPGQASVSPGCHAGAGSGQHPWQTVLSCLIRCHVSSDASPAVSMRPNADAQQASTYCMQAWTRWRDRACGRCCAPRAATARCC